MRPHPSTTARHLLGATLAGLLVLAGMATLTPAADAATIPRLTGIRVAGQDWYHAKVTFAWKRVPGATSYQVKWAPTKAKLRRAHPITVKRPRATFGPLKRGATNYVVMRARRGKHAARWSNPWGFRFKNPWPTPTTLHTTVAGNTVGLSWPRVPYASRYRVQYSAAPYGKWMLPASAWLPQSARSTSFTFPTAVGPGDRMLPAPYANPVYVRLQANNRFNGPTASRYTPWRTLFPTPPDPGAGDPVRVGTYNVMLAPTSGPRIAALAANISTHGVDVLALQEASPSTASALVTTLGSGWDYVRNTGPSQQIVYRTAKYTPAASGTFDVRNPKEPSTPITTPWAKLTPVNPSPGSQAFLVTSVHVTGAAGADAMQDKHDAGLEAQDVLAGVAAANPGGLPVVAAGDYHYLREPFGDVPGYVEGPPTLVRAGFYDAMAAVSKTNIEYGTFNSGNGTTAPAQTASALGVAGRADYLLLKGFRGSRAYVNVANWTAPNGLVPSDHNLVYADLVVPAGG